jgi:hypothetical protein
MSTCYMQSTVTVTVTGIKDEYFETRIFYVKAVMLWISLPSYIQWIAELLCDLSPHMETALLQIPS